MATGTFYLRPSADISLGHPVYPTTLLAGYLAISEEVADGTATYIGVTTSPDDTQSFSSTFAMRITSGEKITKVLTATFGYNGSTEVADGKGDSEHACTLQTGTTVLFSGKKGEKWMSDGNNYYGNLDGEDMPDLVTYLNNYLAANGPGAFPQLELRIDTKVDKNNGSKNVAQAFVSQVCVILECEYATGLGIHAKVNGEWKQAQAAYKKVNGAWVEITEEEAKQIIGTGLVRSDVD